MVGGGMGGFWTSIALLAAASAGPLHRYPRESEDYQNDLSVYANYTANEVCFSEGEVFQKGDIMPNPGPCEECRCEPPSIVCNMIKCPVNNNGCRTIQRPNHCCPDYNCECDYNGQMYNDGERLELPEEPCQVCYCKGGEVMCNSITCYHRDDCDPIQVPGQCCPKYENCPVRDMGGSSSDDKTVLGRSTNKTNHVPPKREMNPWLLTKLPPASSSAPPKSSQDPTTEGENIIIVSDWLTERRTTTEDASRSDEVKQNGPNILSTVGPNLYTDSDHPTTVIKQDFSSAKGMVVKNSDAITPIDEVIFTRIDGSKDNQEINVESPASASSRDTQDNLTTFISSSTTSPQTKETTAIMTTTETILSSVVMNEDSKNPNSKLNSKEKESVSGISPIEMTDTEKPTKPSAKVEVDMNFKNHLPTENPIYPNGLNNTLQPDEISSDSPTTPLYIDLTKETKTINVPKDVSLEHLFGIDGLTIGEIEADTTEQDILGSYTTEKEEASTDINDFTGNSLEVQNKEEPKAGELKVTFNEDKTTLDSFSDTTTNSLIDLDDTTPLFTDVNPRKGYVEPGSSKKEQILQEISEKYKTEPPKIKKEIVTEVKISEKGHSPKDDQKVDSTSESILNTGTETSSEFNHSPSTNNIKIKRKNIDSAVDQSESELSVEGPINALSNSVSLTPDVTQQTIITSEGNTPLQKGNLNSPTSVQINDDPPVTKMNSDDPLPTMINLRGDDSDDSKELISDAPPVLELNSHVPFLQFGGHSNLDPDINIFGGNHQTKPTSESRDVLNEKEKEVIDNSSTLKTSLNSLGNSTLPVTQVKSAETGVIPNSSRNDNNDQSNTQDVQKEFTENNQKETETTTDMIFTSTHIPLTPGDLKVLAEYLINDTIKTVPVKNVTDYIPNQWLKGNLTSEEKIASIMSAANISIAIINSTDERGKKYITETTKTDNEPVRIDKFEKDKSFLGNNALNNVKVNNKTSFIQGKKDEYLDSPKINPEPEIPLNDEGKSAVNGVKTNTESPNGYNNNTPVKSTINKNEMTPEKYPANTNNLLNLKLIESQSSTPDTSEMQSISQSTDENNLRFENINPSVGAEKNLNTQNNLLRKDKLLGETTSHTSSISVTTSDPQKQGTP